MQEGNVDLKPEYDDRSRRLTIHNPDESSELYRYDGDQIIRSILILSRGPSDRMFNIVLLYVVILILILSYSLLNPSTLKPDPTLQSTIVNNKKFERLFQLDGVLSNVLGKNLILLNTNMTII